MLPEQIFQTNKQNTINLKAKLTFSQMHVSEGSQSPSTIRFIEKNK